MLNNTQTLQTVFNGYMIGQQFDWKNRISGKNKGILLTNAKDIKYVHVQHFCSKKFFLNIKHQQKSLVMTYCAEDYLTLE